MSLAAEVPSGLVLFYVNHPGWSRLRPTLPGTTRLLSQVPPFLRKTLHQLIRPTEPAAFNP